MQPPGRMIPPSLSLLVSSAPVGGTLRPRDRSPDCRPGRPRRPVYPHRPMATAHRPDTLARERAHELVRSWDGRPGALGSLLGRVSSVDQVGVEERVDALKKRSIKKAVEALGARSRDPDDRSHDPRGEGHPGQGPGPLREGDAPPAGRPDDPVGRGDLRLSRRSSPTRRRRSRARPSRSPRSRPASRRARRSATSSWPRPAQPPRPAPTRSTWSSTAGRSCRGDYLDRVRGDRRRQGRLRRRPPQGDPRDRRARDLRQRPPGERPGDGRRAPTSSRPRPAR